MKMANSIPELVDLLGGADTVAAWAGYEDARGVYNWTSRGIPPGYHMRLTLEAWSHGYEIAPHVLGLDDRYAALLRDLLMRKPRRRVQGRRGGAQQTAGRSAV